MMRDDDILFEHDAVGFEPGERESHCLEPRDVTPWPLRPRAQREVLALHAISLAAAVAELPWNLLIGDGYLERLFDVAAAARELSAGAAQAAECVTQAGEDLTVLVAVFACGQIACALRGAPPITMAGVAQADLMLCDERDAPAHDCLVTYVAALVSDIAARTGDPRARTLRLGTAGAQHPCDVAARAATPEPTIAELVHQLGAAQRFRVTR